MKIELSSKKIWYVLIFLTPIVDTVNGAFLQINGITEALGATRSASIGTFYRAFAILAMLYFSMMKRPLKRNMLAVGVLMYFPAVSFIKGLIDAALFSYISYALKWIYPPLLVIGFLSVYGCDLDEGLRDMKRLLSFFSYSFPSILIAEYVLGLGRSTYYNAGFKGLFYSTNDISFCLVVGFIVALTDFFGNHPAKGFLASILNFVSILILGTKSGILFSVGSVFAIGIYYGLKNRRRMMRSIVFLGLALLAGIIAGYGMKDEISNVISRYSEMLMWIVGSPSRKSSGIMAFLTSGRTDRIQDFFSRLWDSRSVFLEFLVGWIKPDNANVIEMDFHDLLCQFGLIGFSILVVMYLRVFKIALKKEPVYLYLYFLSMVSALLGGHIISAALSGTVLAVVICCLYAERDRAGRGSEQKEQIPRQELLEPDGQGGGLG